MNFVFYDTETTGTDTSFDQILQFAAIYTDADLNELDRFEVRCRLLPHVVPAPGAMRVTGVTAAQLVDTSFPSHYAMIGLIREKMEAWSPAIFLGYNSLNFDEHLLRQAFYKTLHPPYLTNTDGNSRSDVLRMVQAASLFAPDALTYPAGEDGKTVLKLDRLAPANGFDHENAHDALADVEATIFICRLLMDHAPEVWSAFMRFSQKPAVVDYVSTERIFSLSDFYFGRPYSWLVTVIGANSQNASEFYAYDLAVHPDSLSGMSDAALASRFGRSPKPIRRLKSNTSPIIMPFEDAPAIASSLNLGVGELRRRAEILHSSSALRDRLVTVFEMAREPQEPSPHVEKQIYDDFIPTADRILSEAFHYAPWEDRLAIVEKFGDARLRLLGRRLIHAERPDLLPDEVRQEHDREYAKRLLGAAGDAPWLTLPKALEQLDDLLAATSDPTNTALLTEHRQYLFDRLVSQKSVLID